MDNIKATILNKQRTKTNRGEGSVIPRKKDNHLQHEGASISSLTPSMAHVSSLPSVEVPSISPLNNKQLTREMIAAYSVV